ncbi:hypothetical protein Vafri_4210 [Volvox africanus]|uniref:Metallo-beta-lactamase domain-containing protein n=1 Tax=Volvox africanus TaxID=51714 RepID=A0A8J4EUG2_9CHLO|nr:hypothetical protein Vafri_4210 [Volvox africanus]
MASQVERIKWVPGTDFLVDGFAFKNTRCSHYFLTHFHSDHTVGLNKSFNGGVIYCSHITARLLVHDMGIRPQLVKPLALGTAVIVEGVRVTPLDANHCPGSVMFLFEVPSSRVNKSQPLATTTSPATRVGTPGFPANHPTVDSPPARAAGATVTSVASTDETQDVGADGAGDGSALSAVCAGGDVHDASECGGRAAAATHNILHTGDCRWECSLVGYATSFSLGRLRDGARSSCGYSVAWGQSMLVTGHIRLTHHKLFKSFFYANGAGVSLTLGTLPEGLGTGNLTLTAPKWTRCTT